MQQATTCLRIQRSEDGLGDNLCSTSNASLAHHYEQSLLHSLCNGKALNLCALNGHVSRNLFFLQIVLDNARTCMVFQSLPAGWSGMPFNNIFLQDFQEDSP